MPSSITSYIEVLNANRQISFSTAIKEYLNSQQSDQLVEDVLYDKTKEINFFFEENRKANKYSFYNSNEIAFDNIINLPFEWLFKKSPFIEELFARAWINRKQGEPEERVVSKIKTLVATTGTGIRSEFINKYLLNDSLTPVERLEFYLLLAIIEEKKDGSELENLKSKVDIEKHPELTVLKIYIDRKKAPYNAIQTLLLLDENIVAELKEYKPDDNLRSYFLTYLRQSIFNLLHNSKRETYWQFFSLQSRFKSEWIRELFRKAFEHPALEDIKISYEKFSVNLSEEQFLEFENKFDL